MANVSGVIKSIQDIMRKDAGVDGDAQRIGQLVWMFFLKIFDDQEEKLTMLGAYQSPLPKHLRWSAWATDAEGITGDALLDFINNQLFLKLKNLPLDGPERKRAKVVRDAFADAYNYMKSGTLMRQVINKINDVDFNATGDMHAFGDVYEQILKDLQSAGNAGEFYTPRSVTQFMVDMIDPKLDEMVLDPACGTGGFLAHVLDHKIDHYVETVEDRATVQNSIHGVEKKALPHLLCITNMLLHGIETPTNIVHDNTLETPIRDHPWRGEVDVIISNPPFGGMEEDGIEQKFAQAYRTRETADLFLVLIIELLKDGGRAAVVLPDGTLFGEGVKTRIKEKLLSECNLHTIVRLPNGVFNPYTGIKTNLLFFEKGKPTEDIWFYEHPYPEGYKNYSKTRPMQIEEFDTEKAWWGDLTGRAGREATPQSWRVSVDEIKARNFNLDISNPNTVEAGHGDPQELLAAWSKNRDELSATQGQLKAILAEALGVPVAAQTMPTTILFDNFDALVSAPNGVGKLRELVLQLAVRGQLSSRMDSDDAISDLLHAIEEEKQLHLKSGLSSKLNGTTAPKNQPPFLIPQHWTWVKLNQLCSYIQRGKGPIYDDAGSIQIVSQKCVQWAGFNPKPCRRLDEVAFAKYGGERLLRAGDLLWNSTGTGTIGRINVFPNLGDETKFVADSHVTVLRLAVVDPRYVWGHLASPTIQATLEGDASGSTNQVELSSAYVRDTWIPLPPLAEQRRIVAKVDELMSLCDKLETQLLVHDRLSDRLFASLTNAVTDNGPYDGNKPSLSKPDFGSQMAENSTILDHRPHHQDEIPRKSQNSGLTPISPNAAPVDTKFQEAALVSAIVKSFFADGGEPIGNFRLQKAVYFARRHNADPSATADFLKKAAGPYNPSMKYSGGIAIAKAKNYIAEARGRYGFGHIPGATIAELEPAVERYGYNASATWVNQHFKFKKNEEWELLATVDYAMLQVRDATPADILAYVANDPEWRPKIEKLGLTEFKIESAMLEIGALFPNANGSA